MKAAVNHSWKYDGDPGTALYRTCVKCGARGQRTPGAKGPHRWQTRLAPGGGWTLNRVPPCPARRPSRYVPLDVLVGEKLMASGIVPYTADLKVEHVHGHWQKLPTRDRPAWRAAWTSGQQRTEVFSLVTMRRCADAAVLRLEGDEVVLS